MELSLQTPRLRLHSLQPQDHALYCSLFTDSRTMHFVGPPFSPTRALRSFEAVMRCAAQTSPAQFFWRIVEQATRSAIGIGSIRRRTIDGVPRIAEIGLMLEPAHQGLGLGREALVALGDAAFRIFPIEAIWVQYHAENKVAERLFISNGFELVVGAGTDKGSAPMRIRSAHRHSWSRPGIRHQLGVHACQT